MYCIVHVNISMLKAIIWPFIGFISQIYIFHCQYVYIFTLKSFFEIYLMFKSMYFHVHIICDALFTCCCDENTNIVYCTCLLGTSIFHVINSLYLNVRTSFLTYSFVNVWYLSHSVSSLTVFMFIDPIQMFVFYVHVYLCTCSHYTQCFVYLQKMSQNGSIK